MNTSLWPWAHSERITDHYAKEQNLHVINDYPKCWLFRPINYFKCIFSHIFSITNHKYMVCNKIEAERQILHRAHTRDSNSDLLMWCLLSLGVVAQPLEKIWFIRGPECGGRKSSRRFRIIMKPAVMTRMLEYKMRMLSNTKTGLGVVDTTQLLLED